MTATFMQRLDRRWYPTVCNNWDDALLRSAVARGLSSQHVLLDLGAGGGRVAAMNFRGVVRRSVGVDVDRAIAANRQIDLRCIGLGERLPFQDGVFDVVVADNVLEHLEYPEGVFSEVGRVLKPGGRFLVKTPNAWHYVPVLAALTPHRFHQWVNRRRGRDGADTFPTRYRANTKRVLRRLAAGAGLRVQTINAVEGRPEYLRFHYLSYTAGFVYERIVNSGVLGAPFRLVLLAEFVRDSVDR